MRHFSHLPEEDIDAIFALRPSEVDSRSTPAEIAAALGATMYVPSIKPDLPAVVTKQHRATGVASLVLCLEDAIPDDRVAEGVDNIVATTRALADHDGDIPLLFVRVRRADQIEEILDRTDGAFPTVFSGFVLPKFDAKSGDEYMETLAAANASLGAIRLRAMPVLESRALIHRETREGTLNSVARTLARHHDDVLAVRIGATDMSSAFGIRRGRDFTIYDVHVVASAIADVVNALGRAEDGFTITGPVWEHFSDTSRLFKPMLRETPFARDDARALRAELILKDLDGLIREVRLDRTNGLVGKTVIHPTHVPIVNGMSIVSHEEYSDARDVLDQHAVGGGVRASQYRNKMNEAGPHAAWARRTLERAEVFGVAQPNLSVASILGHTMGRS